MTAWSRPQWRQARKTHHCWSCARTLGVGEHYSAQTVFGVTPARLATCEHCWVLYRTCPADLRSDTLPDAYLAADEWDGDIPAEWETHITAWRNQWQHDGQLVNVNTIAAQGRASARISE